MYESYNLVNVVYNSLIIIEESIICLINNENFKKFIHLYG